MTTRSTVAVTRSRAVLDAAVEVFLRYGFRKTSMEDVAREAGISRQGLYLHFSTKEALFHASLQHYTIQILDQVHAALARKGASLEERLFDAFEALHGGTVEEVPQERTAELIQAAAAHGAELVAQLRREFTGAVANTLRQSAVAERWGKIDLSAKQLAEHLFAAADGIHRLSETGAAFRASMRVAIRIIVEGV